MRSIYSAEYFGIEVFQKYCQKNQVKASSEIGNHSNEII